MCSLSPHAVFGLNFTYAGRKSQQFWNEYTLVFCYWKQPVAVTSVPAGELPKTEVLRKDN